MHPRTRRALLNEVAVLDREVLERAMRRALALAQRGPTDDPNPQVGCVLLDGEGAAVAEGWHRGAGSPHAEVDALAHLPEQWRSRARELTAVVTLEPCNHTGRTGPCAVALAEQGIGTVVYALDDPGAAAGGGSETLRRAGVTVHGGMLAAEAHDLLAPWLTRQAADAGAHANADSAPLPDATLANADSASLSGATLANAANAHPPAHLSAPSELSDHSEATDATDATDATIVDPMTAAAGPHAAAHPVDPLTAVHAVDGWTRGETETVYPPANGVSTGREVGAREEAEWHEEAAPHQEIGARQVGARPHVTVKWAQTLDGRAAAADGSSQWITGPDARGDVHRRRAEADAILVGTGTLHADNPSLTARGETGDLLVPAQEQPIPVVFGRREIPSNAQILQHPALEAQGLETPLQFAGDDLPQHLEELHKRGVRRLFVEGGPTVASAFLRAGLVDDVLVYVAPSLLGGPRLAIADIGVENMANIKHLQITHVAQLGADLLIKASIVTPEEKR